MIYKEIAFRKRTCRQCEGEIKGGEECFRTTSSGHYDHTVCKKCVVQETNKPLGKKLLFVCSANINRSPTFERYFKKVEKKGYEIKSAGFYFGDPIQINEKILEWADAVYVMDISHQQAIFRKYPDYITKCNIVGVSDQYQPDGDDLIDLIKFWEKQVLKLK